MSTIFRPRLICPMNERILATDFHLFTKEDKSVHCRSIPLGRVTGIPCWQTSLFFLVMGGREGSFFTKNTVCKGGSNEGTVEPRNFESPEEMEIV